MIARSVSHLSAATVILAAALSAQDMFPSTRVTFDPVQEGFPSWSADGSFIIFQRFSWTDSLGRNGIWKVSPRDTQATQVYSGIAEHPCLSPNGRQIVFDADTGASMKMVDSEGREERAFLPESISIRSGGLPCWSPTGKHIAFKDAVGSLCVFDVAAGTVARIHQEEGKVALPGCWTPDGKSILIALMDRQTRKSSMWKVSADGAEKRLITGHHENFYRHLALSPDGSLLVYGAMEGRDLGLWVMAAEGGPSVPLAIIHPGHNDGPAWSPDGKRLAFASTRSGGRDIWVMEIDVDVLTERLRSSSPK